MDEIRLPHGVHLRSYQKRVWNAFFKHHKKHALLIWHRRAGKTKFAVNLIAAASQLRVGAYYYLFPQLGQAKKTIWDGRGDDGLRFIDHFPKKIIKKINNSEKQIEFVNGSLFQLLGTDKSNFQKARGTNPVGILFDEFATQDPEARDTLIPVLAQNKGWELIISTPYGTNHLYDLYNNVKNDKQWYVEKLTIDQTYDNMENPIVTREMVEEFERSGWSEDRVQQELYCSFTAAIKGAIFSKEIKQARQDGRIGNIEIDSSLPVSTYWDLGHYDSTSIWVVQKLSNEIRCIAYYENNTESISHYINWLRDFRDKHNLVFDMHFGPHDVTSKHVSTGKSTAQIASELGFRFERVPRISDKQAAIDQARHLFSRCYFDEERCKRGIRCLSEYHKHWNESTQSYGSVVHDWSSHGADAFMTLAQTHHIQSNPNFKMQTFRLMDGLL